MGTVRDLGHAPSAIVLASLLLAVGCDERDASPASPCTYETFDAYVQLENVSKVDLLFVIDNSSSMGEQQAALAAEVPSLIRILTTGDFDPADGLPWGDDPNDFDPFEDLQVGVVTSDMGTGGFTVPTCERPDFGDDGLLRTQGNTAAGCMATYPTFLGFRRGGDTDAFVANVACVALPGASGCDFEQPLEALLKAASPSAPTSWTAPGYTAPMFFENTFGHADRENLGFIREGSALALVPVTNGDDCSARDPEVFNPSSTIYGSTDLSLRCFAHADTALQPIDRFVDGFLQLRTRPGLLIFAPIVGIPQDLVPPPGGTPDYERLVSPDPSVRDDRMEARIDPAMPTRLLSSCTPTDPERGSAFPPVRIVQVAQELQSRGAGVSLESICDDDFRGALLGVIRLVTSTLANACLPYRFALRGDGTVACEATAVLPRGMSDCAAVGGEPRLEDGEPVLADDRTVCVLTQLVPTDRSPSAPAPTGVGWYYDDYTSRLRDDCDQRLAFAPGLPPGVTVRLHCLQSVRSGDTLGVGTACDPEEVEMRDRFAPNPCGGGLDPALRPDSLDCDPISRTCAVPCNLDRDCTDAGLVGYVCDTRSLERADPTGHPGDTAPYAFCVNPTCA